MLKHTGTIQIQSEQLILRKFVYSDIPHMLKNWIANPAVQNEYGEPAYKIVDDVHELLSKWIMNFFKKDMLYECFEKTKLADGILLGSPVYSADVTANMKAFLERAGVVVQQIQVYSNIRLVCLYLLSVEVGE